MLIQIREESPTVQTDLLRNSVHRLSPEDRFITGAYMQAISTASQTSMVASVALFVSDILVADLVYDSGTQSSGTLDSGKAEGYNLFPVESFCPAGSEIRAIVNTGSNLDTVIITIQLDLDPAGEDEIY